MKPRLARTLLKTLLSETTQPLGAYYGSILGLNMIAGSEGVRVLILPNIHALDDELKDALADGSKKAEVDVVVDAVVRGLETLEGDALSFGKPNGADGMDVEASEGEKSKVLGRLGSVIGERVLGLGRRRLRMAVCEADIEL